MHEIMHAMIYDGIIELMHGIMHEMMHGMMNELMHQIMHDMMHEMMNELMHDIMHEMMREMMHEIMHELMHEMMHEMMHEIKKSLISGRISISFRARVFIRFPKAMRRVPVVWVNWAGGGCHLPELWLMAAFTQKQMVFQ